MTALVGGVVLLAPFATAAPVQAAGSVASAWVGDDSSSTPLRLRFDTPAQAPGSVVREVVNSGTADVSAEIVSAGGGAWRSVDRHGQSVETPAFTRWEDAPQAILGVTPEGSGDALAPGYASFEFGADFQIDWESDGTSRDDGDNLVQRGLSGDVSQYKIQIDNRRPACRIKGSAGSVKVVASNTVPASTWINVSCRRYAERVVLTVMDMDSGAQSITTDYGLTGAVRPETPDVPLSVGGKLNADGGIVYSSDQFNGVIDEVFVRVY